MDGTWVARLPTRDALDRSWRNVRASRAPRSKTASPGGDHHRRADQEPGLPQRFRRVVTAAPDRRVVQTTSLRDSPRRPPPSPLGPVPEPPLILVDMGCRVDYPLLYNWPEAISLTSNLLSWSRYERIDILPGTTVARSAARRRSRAWSTSTPGRPSTACTSTSCAGGIYRRRAGGNQRP